MKRLLAYLFIVLSLGLVLSLSSYAVQSYSVTVVNKKTFHKYIGVGTSKNSASRDAMRQCKKKKKKNSNCLYEKEFDRYFKTLKPSNNQKTTGSTDMLVEWVEMSKTKKDTSQKQKVAETVSLQLNKNEVDAIFLSVNSCWSIPLGLPYNQDLSVKIKVKFDPSGNAIRTEIVDFAKINKKGNAYLKVLAESALRAIKLCSPIRAPKDKYDLWKEVVFNFDAKDVLNGTESKDTKIAKNNLLNKAIETQIAKAEPSQTQKVPKEENNRKDILKSYDNFLAKKYQITINNKNVDKLKNSFRGVSSNDFNNQTIIAKIDNTNLTTQNFVNFLNETGKSHPSIIDNLDNNIIEELLSELISWKLIDLEIKEYKLSIDDSKIIKAIKENKNFHDKNGIFQRSKYENFLLSKNLTAVKFEDKLRKQELTKLLFDSVVNGTLPPKKKVKVAKVEEPKQEEFKPENKDIDNDAPVIEIAQNITVDSQTYTLKGKVKDKSKLYLEANGRPLKISKRGNFELEGFVVDPDAGDKIKIVAIDQWKNKSEKTINIKVEFKEIAELRSYEKPNPSKIKVKQDKNKIAIIIGIEKYKTLKNIDAPYANRDANAFRAYANRALGIPNKNIKVLIDENATRGETLKALTLWLPQIARGKNKDIYVFFAGHGLASDDGKNLYILPQDGDAALLQYTALSRLEIFDLINRVEPNSVTMFFDTCYSGQTRDERMLVAGLRPIRLVAEEQEVQNNFTIFTASNYDQTSGSIEEAKHGIFSYYLMMGMQGKADSNQDKKITNGELIAYLKQNVSEEAFINNRQQEPMLSGDPDKVLISYR